eukprot:531062-Karenia_brevis.AAC.1
MLWVRTKDTASASWAEYSPNEDAWVKEQIKWLKLNARRRGGVQGTIPECHGMPVEVLNGSSSHCKNIWHSH